MMGRWKRGVHCTLVLAMGLGVACSDDSASKSGGASPAKPATTSSPAAVPAPPPPPPVEDTRTEKELVEAGRGVYNGNCIACHNLDATKDGALGPAVAGSSLELLEARVLRSEYPASYTPKRDTRVMVALPHLAPKLKELAAYLASLE